MRYRMMIAPAALGFAALLPAQEIVKDVQVEVRGEAGPGRMGIASQNATFEFIAAEPAMMFGKAVTGAPYSGEGFTETIQTLADGTRITRKSSKKVYRDSKGRTREENSLPMLGPWAAQGGAPPKFITITDPVAKVIYILNERDKTATKRKMPNFEATRTEAGHVTKERHEMIVREDGVKGAFGVAEPRADMMMHTVHMSRVGPGKEEALGTQTMEGLKVEGKRMTRTVAAGEVGNDRALVTVSENWTSPELQVLVRSLTKDPQMGENSYRLTNLSRSEPAASLFEPPADYAVKEANEMFRIQRDEKK